MKLIYNMNRSGKVSTPTAPDAPGSIPADPAADDLGMTAILIAANGHLVSADPVPDGVAGAFRFGDPQLADTPIYVMLCASVSSRQLGDAGPSQGASGDVFSGSVRCGNVIYIGAVSSLSESFVVQGNRKITINFAVISDLSVGISPFVPLDLTVIHANATYLDIADLANSDLVIYPGVEVADPSDPSVVRTWNCGLSEAPTSVSASSVSCGDGAGGNISWFASIFPSGIVQPETMTMNIIGTTTRILLPESGMAQYRLATPITRPIAITFPDKTFFWPCIGYSKERHSAEVYLARMSDPMRVLAVAEGACSIVIGPVAG